MDRLFVYGTLAPGRPNHKELADVPGTWRAASLNGILHEEGWGAAMGCPAVVPSDDGPPVDGYVFESDALNSHWHRLDAFEGSAYERVPVVVHTAEGDRLDAWVYALRRDA
ncbi:MAG: gamma-glutamylcyclotransferase family protein [Pseudomonadota bacterium]